MADKIVNCYRERYPFINLGRDGRGEKSAGISLVRPWPTARVYFFEDTQDGYVTVWWLDTSLTVPEEADPRDQSQV